MRISPDKPVSTPIRLLRDIVRQVRMRALQLRTGGRLVYGSNAYIAKGADLYIPEAAVMGKNVSIGAHFTAQTNFYIGDECLLSSNVSFIGNDHDVYGRSAYFSGRNPPSKIVLVGNNFIGYGATIVGSITIGRDAVVGAGAVVVADVEAGVVVGGVPARLIKRR